MRRRRKHASHLHHDKKLVRGLEARRKHHLHTSAPTATSAPPAEKKTLEDRVSPFDKSLDDEEYCKHIAVLHYCVEVLAEREESDKPRSAVWEFKRKTAADLLRLWCITTGKQTYVIYDLSADEKKQIINSHPLLKPDLGPHASPESPEHFKWHEEMREKVHHFIEKLKDYEDS